MGQKRGCWKHFIPHSPRNPLPSPGIFTNLLLLELHRTASPARDSKPLFHRRLTVAIKYRLWSWLVRRDLSLEDTASISSTSFDACLFLLQWSYCKDPYGQRFQKIFRRPRCSKHHQPVATFWGFMADGTITAQSDCQTPSEALADSVDLGSYSKGESTRMVPKGTNVSSFYSVCPQHNSVLVTCVGSPRVRFDQTSMKLRDSCVPLEDSNIRRSD